MELSQLLGESEGFTTLLTRDPANWTSDGQRLGESRAKQPLEELRTSETGQLYTTSPTWKHQPNLFIPANDFPTQEPSVPFAILVQSKERRENGSVLSGMIR